MQPASTEVVVVGGAVVAPSFASTQALRTSLPCGRAAETITITQQLMTKRKAPWHEKNAVACTSSARGFNERRLRPLVLRHVREVLLRRRPRRQPGHSSESSGSEHLPQMARLAPGCG